MKLNYIAQGSTWRIFLKRDKEPNKRVIITEKKKDTGREKSRGRGERIDKRREKLPGLQKYFEFAEKG